MEAAKPLGGELGHSVDIPRRERPQADDVADCLGGHPSGDRLGCSLARRELTSTVEEPIRGMVFTGDRQIELMDFSGPDFRVPTKSSS
jgi:hypothetical protein